MRHAPRIPIFPCLSVGSGGVALSVLSKCVAGHASILMTRYYLKQGPLYISQRLAEAQAKLLEREQETIFTFYRIVF